MKDRTEKKIIDVLKPKGEIIFTYLYGSYLDSSLFNDIDIALFLKKDRMPSDLLFYTKKISLELSDRTETLVDVRVINYAPVGFLHTVFCRGDKGVFREEDMKIIYEDIYKNQISGEDERISLFTDIGM
jgi:predicted nucleotidyltransferase